jgi:hypothetical protein
MAYSLPDGTKIDQVIWDNTNLYGIGLGIMSNYFPVPAIHTGRLKILIYAKNNVIIYGERLTLDGGGTRELNPYCGIYYFDKNYNGLLNKNYISSIKYGSYGAGKIITEFNIPNRLLKEIINWNKIYYCKLYINCDKSRNSGNISAYLIWE